MPLAEFQHTTLLHTLQQPGCPLCQAVWKMDAARFGWYVNDGVLDEETQRNVVRVIGFCGPHALYLSLIEGNDFLWSYLGSCMVYIHVIEYALLSDLERCLPGLATGFYSRSGARSSFHCATCFITTSACPVLTIDNTRRPIKSNS